MKYLVIALLPLSLMARPDWHYQKYNEETTKYVDNHEVQAFVNLLNLPNLFSYEPEIVKYMPNCDDLEMMDKILPKKCNTWMCYILRTQIDVALKECE